MVVLVVVLLWGVHLISAALETQDITIITPAAGTWHNSNNYTTGFNATWDDLDDEEIDMANCTLLIGSTNITGQATAHSSNYTYNNTYFVLFQNGVISNLQVASATRYWTILCYNKSNGAAPPMRAMYYKNTTTDLIVTAYSFTNATIQDSCSGWFSLNSTDTTELPTGSYTYYVLNSTGPQTVSYGTGTGANATGVNVSFTVTSDGTFPINISVNDPADNVNYSILDYSFVCDSASPTITWNTGTVANATSQAATYTRLNFTVTEGNIDTTYIEFDGTNTLFPLGYSTYDDAEDAASGAVQGHDEDWATYVDSVVSGNVSYENYTTISGTDMEDITNVQYVINYNLTNSSGNMTVDFYDYTANAWYNVFSNNTLTGAVRNDTITEESNSSNVLVNTSHPFMVRINVSDGAGNAGNARFYEGQARFNFSRSTPVTGGRRYFYNFTGISDSRNIYINVTVNDTLDQTTTSTLRYLSIDTGTPQLSDQTNWTITDSSLAWRFLITDTTPSTCIAIVHDRSNNKVEVAGTLGAIGATTNCTGAITGASFTDMGYFVVEYNATDAVANSNISAVNKTGVIKALYDGWNLVTWAFTDTEVIDICDSVNYCTGVSYYNNTAGANDFVTYSSSTPSTNNATTISSGDAVLVYVSADDYLIMNEHMPKIDEANENITITNENWKVFGLIRNSNITAVLDAVNETGDRGNVPWATYWNASAETYYTCSKAATLCSGTTTLPTNLPLYMGDAVWILTTDNQTINRSSIL